MSIYYAVKVAVLFLHFFSLSLSDSPAAANEEGGLLPNETYLEASGGGGLLPNETHMNFTVNCSSTACNPTTSLAGIASLPAISESVVYINITVDILISVPIMFDGKTTSVNIYGNHHQLNCSSRESGLEFQSTANVAIEDMEIHNCGMEWRINKKAGIVVSALHFFNNSIIKIHNIRVTNSNGSGMNIQRPRNSVTVTNSVFEFNRLLGDIAMRDIRGGNGVFFYMTDSSSVHVLFKNCTFFNNTASGKQYDFVVSDMTGRGRGGGIGLTLSATTSNVLVEVINCTFEENKAYLGSGLSAKMEGSGNRSNEVSIRNTLFRRNGCTSAKEMAAGIGGGLYLSFERLDLDDDTNNKLNIMSVTFDSNCAVLGGGTYAFSDKFPSRNTGSMVFDNCTWQNNFAHIGSAVDLTPEIFTRKQVGHLPQPEFKDCKFINNHIQDIGNGTQDQIYGSGTLYSSLMDIKFTSNVEFLNNIGSGIVIVNADLNFTDSNATFTRNIAAQGGAILLTGLSTMFVGGKKKYLFENNTAHDRGGAIYVHLVDDADFIVSRSCFFMYQSSFGGKCRLPCIYPSSEWNSSLVFRGNKAKEGHSIFATSILPCQVGTSTAYKVLDVKDIFQLPGIDIENKDKDDIATEGVQFNNYPMTLKVVPGHQTELKLDILDDLGNSVNSTLTAFLRSSSKLKVSSIISSTTDHQSIKLIGQEGEQDDLFLQTLGSRKRTLRLPVLLLNCPPAFILEKGACVCDSSSYVGIARCVHNVAYLNQGFWAGYINVTTASGELVMIFATSVCPEEYCMYRNESTVREVKLHSSEADLEEALCGKKRKGILCGACREGYTVYYNSPDKNCDEAKPFSCKLGWLFYILSELVPVTVLLALVLRFNINFTTGAVNSFILFSQLQDIILNDTSVLVVHSPVIATFTRIYKVIYGFFNLDLFNIEPLSFCLWKNASVLDMLALKYVTVLYSFLLVLLVIAFMRYCGPKCLGPYYSLTAVRNSMIHGLSGFLVLCYGQVLKVSFNILYRQKLTASHRISQNDSISLNSLARVWFSGDVEYFGLGHLPYALVALAVIIILGGIPPLILICYPLSNKLLALCKLENAKILQHFNYFSRLKPLLDSFQGSFKDRYRFFAGLYFFYRWVPLIIYTYTSSFSSTYASIQVVFLVILIVHNIIQPHQKTWHNLLDSLVFANLIIITGITYFTYYLSRVDSGRHVETDPYIAIQVGMIFLPILYIILYNITWIVKKLCFPQNVNDGPPGKDEFVLKKIRKKIHSSSFPESEEDILPYRLLGHKEDVSFVNSTEFPKPKVIDTY